MLGRRGRVRIIRLEVEDFPDQRIAATVYRDFFRSKSNTTEGLAEGHHAT